MEKFSSGTKSQLFAFSFCLIPSISSAQGNEILMSGSDGGTTMLHRNDGMPNAHVAALVMALIVFCLLCYFAYRCFRNRFCPFTHLINIDPQNDPAGNVLDKERELQRQLYLSIYGKRDKQETNETADHKKESIPNTARY